MTDDGNINTRQGEVEEEAADEQVQKKKRRHFMVDSGLIPAWPEVTTVVNV